MEPSNAAFNSAETMVAVNGKISRRASLNKGLLNANINVATKGPSQKTAAISDDQSQLKSEVSTSKVAPQLTSPRGNPS